jgi:hypothetical protein
MNYAKEFKEHYNQLLYTFYTYPQSIRFIFKHKLWDGFWKYSWVGKLLLLGAILLGLKFIGSLTNWFQEADVTDPIAAMSSVGSLMFDVVSDEYQFLTEGSMRYLMIILLEVVIFHVCRKSLSILTGKDSDSTMGAFIKAQIRMIKVVIFCYVMEMLLGIGIKAFFGIFGFLDFFKPILLFISSIFFMGFAVMDNYLEQFEMTIKESFKYCKSYIGIALGTGLALNVFFMVPLVGPVIAPFIAAVTVTLAMFELTDVHLLDKKTVLQLEELV